MNTSMKIPALCAVATLSFGLAFAEDQRAETGALNQGTPQVQQGTQQQQEFGARTVTRTQQQTRQSEVYEVSELEGLRVENMQGDNLGKVDSLAVDLQGEHPSFIVVESGGIIGIGADLRVVPIDMIEITRTDALIGDRQVVRIDIEENRWNELPTHEVEEIVRLGDPTLAREVFQTLGVDWDQRRGIEFGARELQGTEVRELVLTNKLQGRSIHSTRQEELGTVNDIVFDVANGRVHYVLIKPDTAFFETTDEVYAIGPRSFSTITAEQVTLDVTREHLERAEVLTQTRITERTDETTAGDEVRVYRYNRDEITFGAPDRDVVAPRETGQRETGLPETGQRGETGQRERPGMTDPSEGRGTLDRDPEFGRPDREETEDPAERRGPPPHAQDPERRGPPPHAQDPDRRGPPPHANDGQRDARSGEDNDTEFGAPERDTENRTGAAREPAGAQSDAEDQDAEGDEDSSAGSGDNQ